MLHCNERYFWNIMQNKIKNMYKSTKGPF